MSIEEFSSKSRTREVTKNQNLLSQLKSQLLLIHDLFLNVKAKIALGIYYSCGFILDGRKIALSILEQSFQPSKLKHVLLF